MKYLLLICADPDLPETDGDPTIHQWLDEVGDRRLDGSALRSRPEATTVRTRGDEVLLSDGPFAETKEHIVGYDVVECADLDEAIVIAARHPVARYGAVEIRPFRDL